MYKQISSLLVAMLCAVGASAANNIRMVTYFPVPYVAYNDLEVTGPCDVGLLNTCILESKTLEVMPSGSSAAYDNGTMLLKKGDLSVDGGAIVGSLLNIGDGNTSTAALTFKHQLNMNGLPEAGFEALEADNKAYIRERLNLFGEDFPTCGAEGHAIQWQSITVGESNKIFLVCGEASESGSQD